MGYESGGEVTPFYDSLLGKIIAHGPGSRSARKRLIAALEETHVLGVRTNAAMFLDILRDEALATGEVHTGTLAQWSQGRTPGRPPPSSPLSPTRSATSSLRHPISQRGEDRACFSGAWDLLDGFRNARPR